MTKLTKPSPPPPVSSKTKDYKERPMETLDELDDLRKRGTAKLLNKHFTQTIQQVAKEQAEAERALQEFERKKHKSASSKSSNAAVAFNPYDAVYLQLKEAQKQCRRKEQETLLLYQRYVAKYGDTGLVAVPSLQRKRKKSVYAGRRAVVQSANNVTLPAHAVSQTHNPSLTLAALTSIPPVIVEKDAASSSSDEVEIGEDTLKNQQDLNFKSYYKKLYAQRAKSQSEEEQDNDRNDRNDGDDNGVENDGGEVVEKEDVVNEEEAMEKEATDTAKEEVGADDQVRTTVATNAATITNKEATANMVTGTNKDKDEDEDEDEDMNEPPITPSTAATTDNTITTTEINEDTPAQVSMVESTAEEAAAAVSAKPEIAIVTPHRGYQSNQVNISTETLLQDPNTAAAADPQPNNDDLILETPKKALRLSPTLLHDPLAMGKQRTISNDDDEDDEQISNNPFLPANLMTQPAIIPNTPATQDATPIKSNKAADAASSNLLSKAHADMTPVRNATAGYIPSILPTVSNEVPSATTTEDDDDEDILFTAQNDDDHDLSSIISGLTSVHSGLTKQQLMEDLESQLNTFLETETQNIRKMMDDPPEQASSVASGSLFGAESSRATLQAENMARKMQQVLDNFGQDDGSDGSGKADGALDAAANKDKGIGTGGDDDDDDDDGPKSTKIGYPKKYVTENPDEDWTVHWDSKHRREYYYEKHTKRSMWEAPPSITFQSVDESFSTLHDEDDRSIYSRRSTALIQITHEDVSPTDDTSLKSRRLTYRKQQRKRRKRNLRIAAVFVLLLCAAIVYWRTRSPDVTHAQWIEQETTRLRDAYEYRFTDRAEREDRARAEADRRQTEAQRRAQEERRRAKEEMERAARIHEAKIAAELKAKEDAAARAREQKKQESFQALLRTIAERKLQIEENQSSWNCRLPFSKQFNPRCGGKATLKELEQSGAIATHAPPVVLDETQMVQYLME